MELTETAKAIASTSPRGNFAQGELTALTLTVTDFDGTPADPIDVTYEIIRDSDSYVVKTGVPEKLDTGLFVFEWQIPTDIAPGRYIVAWTYSIDGEPFTEYYSVSVAEAGDSTTLYSGKILMMRQALEMMLCCAQHIPVMYQQAQPSADRKTFRFTKGNWNQKSGTRIYRNGVIMTEGFDIDFRNGRVIFDEPLTSYDVVNADYNFRWFTDEQLDRFLSNAIHRLNSYPPQSPTYNIVNLPEKHVAAVLYGAVVDALRTLMLCMNFQQPAKFFGGDDLASQRFGQLDSLKQNYEKDLLDLLEKKKYFPYVGLTRSVVTPEYTLPGGRSRWFRMLFSGGNI